MFPLSHELNDQPKLVFEDSVKDLNSPIRLVPDDSNKENVHELESDEEDQGDLPDVKKGKIGYSSPEKIEMFDNLSPIKLDTEGEEGAQERETVKDIERAIKDIRKDSYEEEEDGHNMYNERDNKAESNRIDNNDLCLERTVSLDKNSEENLRSSHEIMSPIIIRHEREHSISFETQDWESKFSDLSERITRKNNEIRVLNTELRDLHIRLNSSNEEKEEWELRFIRLEKKASELTSEFSASKHKIQEYDNLKNDFDKLNLRFETCKHKLKEVKIELSMTNQNNQILIEKFEKEYAKFSENENLVNEWRDKHNRILNELNSKKHEIESLSEQLRQKSEELSDKNAELLNVEDEFKALHSHFEKEKTSWTEALREKDTEINDLKQSLLKNETKDADNMSKLKSELNENRQSLQQKIKELDIVQAELESKESESSELSSKLADLAHSKHADTIALENARRELDNLKSKNGNIESEHLAELEKLHENMIQMESNLKLNVRTISDLTSKVADLESKCKSLENEKTILQLQVNDKSSEANYNSSPNTDSNSKDPNLLAKVAELEKTLADVEKETNKKLQLLAEDLYIQYSSKHEQKVKMLKKGYETKYQDLLDKLTLENTALHDEVEQLQKVINTEREEKQALVKSLDTK